LYNRFFVGFINSYLIINILVWLPKAEIAIANPYKFDKAGLNTHILSLSRPFWEIY